MFWSNIFRKFCRKRRKLFNDWPQFWKGCMILVCVFGFWRTWRLQTIVVICVTRHAAKNLLQPRTEEVPWNSCHPLIMVPSQASWSKMDSSRPPNKWARPHSPPILDRYRYEEIFYLKNAAWRLPIYGISQYTYHLWKSKAISRIKGSRFEGFFYEGSQEGYQWWHCCVDWRHFFLKKVPNRKVLSELQIEMGFLVVKSSSGLITFLLAPPMQMTVLTTSTTISSRACFRPPGGPF